MSARAGMDTQRVYARLAGFMYLFVLATSIAGLVVTSSVATGAGFAERSAQIVASESLFRVGLVLALVGGLWLPFRAIDVPEQATPGIPR